jgi:hypothetical protein
MKAAASLAGLLAFGLLVGCESQPHPLQPDSGPAFAATRSMERVVLVEDNVFLVHPCRAELIDLSITTEFVLFSVGDAQGGLRSWIRARVLEATGVGEWSGVAYRLKLTTLEQYHLREGTDGDPQERVHLRANALLVAERQPPITVHLLYVLTTDARGEVRVELDRTAIRCPEGEILDPPDPVPPTDPGPGR